jgi:hypothetical protein
MSMRDFHSPYYVSPRCPLIQDVKAGSQITIPRYLSVMTDRDPGNMTLQTSIAGWNDLGQWEDEEIVSIESISFKAYANEPITNVTLNAPQRNGLYIVRFVLSDSSGSTLHRNFVLLHVTGGTMAADLPGTRVKTFTPFSFTKSKWSDHTAYAMGGDKVNGFGSGFFEYEVEIPDDIQLKHLKSATLIFEASAKRLNGKDSPDSKSEGDFMRGKGTADPSGLPNSYPQTDLDTYPTTLIVSINNHKVATLTLPDDPADHRGALSWQAQSTPTTDPNFAPTHQNTLTLDEAGSYGYLQEVSIPFRFLKPGNTITIRFEVPDTEAHGLALFGAHSGLFPLNPTLFFIRK